MSTIEASPSDGTHSHDDAQHDDGVPDPGAALGAKRVQMPGYDTYVGPLGHLAAERHRLDALTWEHFDVVRHGATIGAELVGADIANGPSEELLRDVRRALHEYKVIFFRNQAFSPEAHLSFARYFGELERHPFLPGNQEYPELVRFEKDAGAGGYENGWHHDVTWREVPSLGAVLRAISVPPSGGDTLFCDMNAAYEGLDDDTKSRIEGMTAVHDFLRAFRQQVKPGQEEAMREQYPQVEHPVVATHPTTGKPTLYVNRFFTDHIVGLESDESFALLDKLCAQADQLEYQCRFHWEDNSVAFWDNMAVQHYAASDYFPDTRIMERASIVGTRPS